MKHQGAREPGTKIQNKRACSGPGQRPIGRRRPGMQATGVILNFLISHVKESKKKIGKINFK